MVIFPPFQAHVSLKRERERDGIKTSTRESPEADPIRGIAYQILRTRLFVCEMPPHHDCRLIKGIPHGRTSSSSTKA